ncbi:MAG: TldD/PmbA family protein [Clostridia bacterium]|nr:TldD/PmbA family protein [Clostridia bacterium]
MNFENIKQLFKQAAEKAGLEEYEVYYSSEESVSTETLKHEISNFSFSTSGGISFRCVYNGKMGSASSELINETVIEELVERAMANACVIESDDEAIIFEGSESYAELPPMSSELPSTQHLKSVSLALEEKLYSLSPMIVDGTQTAAASFVAERMLFNSYGLELSNKIGNSYMMANAVVNNGEESVESFELSRGVETDAADELAQKAVDSAVSKLGAGKVKTGKYNIVFDARQMRSILSTFSPVFSAKNALLGLSLFAGKEGTKVAADCVTITDDAMRDGVALKTTFDGEGVATYRKDVIKDGVLTTLLYDLSTAKKCGKTTTANGHRGGGAISIAPFTMCIEAGSLTLDQLFETAENGIYVTEMKGFHAGADAVTGDFSIECAGFLIENGKKTVPVKTFTVAGNFFTLLQDICALSDEVSLPAASGFTTFGSPAVLVKDMSVAGE